MLQVKDRVVAAACWPEWREGYNRFDIKGKEAQVLSLLRNRNRNRNRSRMGSLE
jgi:hypothetical protein